MFLEFLLTLSDISQDLLDTLTRLVMISLVSENAPETDGHSRLFKLLSAMHQRYPDIVQTCAQEIMAADPRNPEQFENILSQLAIVRDTWNLASIIKLIRMFLAIAICSRRQKG